MPVWRKRWRGFEVGVRYPGRRNRSAEPIRPVDAPKLNSTIPAVAQDALDFLRSRDLRGDGTHPNPTAQRALSEAREKAAAAQTLAEQVASVPWYHTIDLGGGIVTPGSHDLRGFVDRVGIPPSLEGARVLDVGTFDGFWAFEFARRGAHVTAVDLANIDQLDWPRGARDILRNEALNVPLGQAFGIARRALDSNVERVECSIYDLNPASLGTFDFVFVGDLLLHLRDPLEALCRVRDVASDRAVIVDRFDPDISGTGRRLLRYEGGWRGMEWWAPSLEVLRQWVVDAGFDEPTVTGAFRVRASDQPGAGWHRAVMHTRVA